MRSNTILISVLAGSLVALSATAGDTPIKLKTDLEGQYFLVEQGGTANNPILVVKRDDAGYEYYIKREFDCAARTVRYLGEGESLEEMDAAPPAAEASPIEEGTIPAQLVRLACPSR
jgi:hypothetical protein